jgi:hypothetical protein
MPVDSASVTSKARSRGCLKPLSQEERSPATDMTIEGLSNWQVICTNGTDILSAVNGYLKRRPGVSGREGAAS